MKKKYLLFIFILMLGIVSLTGCGTSDDKPEKETDNKAEEKVSAKDYSSYKGVWKTSDEATPSEELIINSIDDKKINFNLFIYKLTNFENVSAEIKDGVATFDTKNSDDWNIKGKIEFKDAKIVFVIDESSSKLLEPQTLEFTIKGTKSVLNSSEGTTTTSKSTSSKTSNSTSNKTSNKTTSKSDDISYYKGVWRNSDDSAPDEELIIKSIDGDKVTFDYLFYKLTTFENVKGTLKGDIVTFDIKNDIEWNIKGTIKLANKKVEVKITDSSTDLIEKGTTTYTLKRDKSKLK